MNRMIETALADGRLPSVDDLASVFVKAASLGDEITQTLRQRATDTAREIRELWNLGDIAGGREQAVELLDCALIGAI